MTPSSPDVVQRFVKHIERSDDDCGMTLITEGRDDINSPPLGAALAARGPRRGRVLFSSGAGKGAKSVAPALARAGRLRGRVRPPRGP